MDRKTWLILGGALLVYFLFIRKSATNVVVASTGAAALRTPTAAVPQPSTAQVALAAGIKAAPQVVSALGSFLSDDSSDDSSSAAFSDDTSDDS